MSELVSTGVEGLDSILAGGITERSTVLVSGNPGTGKSIFGIQYLYHGVTEHDERGVYVSFEEDEADIEQGAVFPDTEVGLENFLTDGNIYFIQTPTDSGVNRYVWVAKMRKQDIDTDIFPMEIGQGGITVHERAGGFSMMGRSEEPSF